MVPADKKGDERARVFATTTLSSCSDPDADQTETEPFSSRSFERRCQVLGRAFAVGRPGEAGALPWLRMCEQPDQQVDGAGGAWDSGAAGAWPSGAGGDGSAYSDPGQAIPLPSCGAIVTVLPRGVIAGRHFGAGAIGLAPHGWSSKKRSLDQVREVLGGRDEERRGWPAVRRWVDAIQVGRMFGGHVRPCPTGWSRVCIAEHVVSVLLDLGRARSQLGRREGSGIHGGGAGCVMISQHRDRAGLDPPCWIVEGGSRV